MVNDGSQPGFVFETTDLPNGGGKALRVGRPFNRKGLWVPVGNVSKSEFETLKSAFEACLGAYLKALKAQPKPAQPVPAELEGIDLSDPDIMAAIAAAKSRAAKAAKAGK